MTPYPWQEPLVDAVVKSLEMNRVFISGFPTGSGKTVIALAADKRLGLPHLVVAPKAALTQWRRTAEKMGVADKLLDVINPEKISTENGCRWYNRVTKWHLPQGTLVTWDEPHRSASGVDGYTTQALAELKAYKGIRLHAMTATLADSPLKLRALGWWTGLHQFNRASFYGWCRENNCHNELVGRAPNQRRIFRFTRDAKISVATMQSIRQAMGDKFMAMKPEDIPDFPTQTVDTMLVDLDTRDKREIDEANEAMSYRMRSPAKDDMAEIGRQRERVEFVMAKAVADLAADFADDGNSVVVFFNFTEPRLRFEAQLKLLSDHGCASIYGGQDDDERQAGIDAFQANKTHIISVMTEAGGAALSLHDELRQRPRVSLILPSWNSSTVKQCLGRIRRCNGTHATQYFVLAAGTVQERVAKTLERKLGNLDALNDADFQPWEQHDDM